MKRNQVISSAIVSIGYDAKKQILEIEFPAHTVYDYYKVPEVIYKGLLYADSKGVFYNLCIKDVYEYKQV